MQLIMKILTPAAINLLIDVPAVFPCVLAAFGIDWLRCEASCGKAAASQPVKCKHMLKHLHAKRFAL